MISCKMELSCRGKETVFCTVKDIGDLSFSVFLHPKSYVAWGYAEVQKTISPPSPIPDITFLGTSPIQIHF